MSKAAKKGKKSTHVSRCEGQKKKKGGPKCGAKGTDGRTGRAIGRNTREEENGTHCVIRKTMSGPQTRRRRGGRSGHWPKGMIGNHGTLPKTMSESATTDLEG